MYKFFSFFIFICIVAHGHASSQILPKEASKLNYRLVGFTFPPVQKAGKYVVEIAIGNFNTEDSFKRNVTQTAYSKNNKIITEVPSFGRQYIWRMAFVNIAPSTAKGHHENLIYGTLHHFSTAMGDETDTNLIRLKILKPAVKYKDAYVFLDGNRALYNMQGQVVWYLPATDRFEAATKAVQAPRNITAAYIQKMPTPSDDLKLTPQGTITFLYNGQAYEVNYDGDVLWKAPDNGKVSGDMTEYYHREFTKCSNGHYMISGSIFETVCWKWQYTSLKDSTLVLSTPGGTNGDKHNLTCNKTEFGTIIEYDSAGNVTWSWNAAKYFIDQDKGRDLHYCEINNRQSESSLHDNSFYFDEKDSVIYVGFRNVSRILKIRYPSGDVVGVYGDDPALIGKDMPHRLFCYQHCSRYSPNGYLYLFNNNVCNLGDLPRVEILAEGNTGDNLHTIWSYECPADGIDMEHDETAFTSGGSVMELPDRSMFVCMGRNYSKTFIVNRNKEVLWSAIPQMWNKTENKWDKIPQYRASVVLRNEIEKMIWDVEKKVNSDQILFYLAHIYNS